MQPLPEGTAEKGSRQSFKRELPTQKNAFRSEVTFLYGRVASKFHAALLRKKGQRRATFLKNIRAGSSTYPEIVSLFFQIIYSTISSPMHRRPSVRSVLLLSLLLLAPSPAAGDLLLPGGGPPQFFAATAPPPPPAAAAAPRLLFRQRPLRPARLPGGHCRGSGGRLSPATGRRKRREPGGAHTEPISSAAAYSAGKMRRKIYARLLHLGPIHMVGPPIKQITCKAGTTHSLFFCLINWRNIR